MAAEVYYVDLLALLRQCPDGIKGSVLYGRIIRRMEYPSVIRPGVALDENGIFVEMEVFAVNVGKHTTILREHGVYNKDEVFMVNGNIFAYVDKRQVNGVDWYQITGTLRRPSGKNAASNCVAMLNFYKNGNEWALSPCKVSDFDIADWDRHGEPYAWIKASADANAIKHPPQVLHLPRFESFDQTTTPTPKRPAPVSEPESEVANIGCVTPIRFNKENRQEVKACGKMHDIFGATLKESDKAKKEFVDSLRKNYARGSCSNVYLSRMLNGILGSFGSRPHQYGMTGKGLVKKYLETNSLAHKSYLGSRSAGEYVASNFREMSQYVLDNRVSINANGVALDLCKAMLGDKEVFYAGVAGVVIGLNSDTVTDIVSFCSNNDLSITKILNENPYILQYFSTLSYDEIERIALCFGKHEDSVLSRYRNTAMLNAYISDTNDGSTLFRISNLARANVGVRMTRTRFNKIRSGYTYLTDAMAANISTYIRDTKQVPLTYSPVGFRQVAGGSYVRAMSPKELQVAIGDYVGAGLGVVKDDYITSSDLMKKELFVFDTMRAMASRTYNYSPADIDKCISEYEQLAGFKLEDSQVKAVHLLTNGAFVVAGSAGSGKTTVSRCVVYTLRKLTPELDIKFAAPTGKAAKRMQEVVQEECRTLHSLFRLSTASDNLFSVDDDGEPITNETAFFFDESAMITVDLMYKVLRRVNVDSTRVFLFGDFNQLSPIGKGLPFKNLLRFMPCVFLDVVKRAAEGSNITANSSIVNDHSDMGSWQWLKNGKDFFLLNCGSDAIQGVVYDLCAHYLGKKPDDGKLANVLGLDKLPDIPGLTPDDIQVVSPLTKSTYTWGATILNQVLQPLFNPARSYDKTFLYQTSKFSDPLKFMIGDRVIHTDKNMYSMQWYGDCSSGICQKIYGQGICNGEVGKVVGFIPADNAQFRDEVEPLPEDFEYTESVRNDASFNGPNNYFVVVEYYDFISARNFYILYRAEVNTNVQSNEGIVFKGDDIQKLNLFYAGTTHKLQGSQAKLIIFALDDINFGGFVTRQMVYTMMTRAEKLCFGVGSVSNSKGSMLSRARMDIASVDTLTVGEMLV